MSRLTLLCAACAGLLLAGPALAEDVWRELLTATADATRSSTYAGEALWITFGAGGPYVGTASVTGTGTGRVVVEASDRHLAEAEAGAGGGQVEALPLPAVLDDPGERLGVLGRNYEVSVEGRERLMDRRSTVLVLHRRDSGMLRERLWIDEASKLLVRRETYDEEGSLLRLGAFLSLDLAPHPPRSGGADDVERDEGPVPLDAGDLDALREAGWTIPDELPPGYEPVAAYTLAEEDGQPLQLVYTDGLYTVSVFQQAGTADLSALPPGAEHVEDVPGEVYEWPGAVPSRLVWAAHERTWSLVGDAPPDDLRTMAAALPAEDGPGLFERLRRGFSRLWSTLSEWGRNLRALAR